MHRLRIIMHKLRIKLSRSGFGVKNRFFWSPKQQTVDMEDWRAVLPLPGAQGGLEAVFMTTRSMNEKFEDHIRDLDDTALRRQ